jgi:cytochrome c oxidase subunit 2
MQQWFPTGASTYAGDMDGLFFMVTAIVGVWFLVAEGVLFYLIFRYRRRKDRPAGYVKGDQRRQMAWVLVPCVAILGFDLFIDFSSTRVWDLVKLTRPTPSRVIRVDGRQWAWDFTNPGADRKLGTADDIKTTNEIHLPTGAVVEIEMRSMDVLHSFWIPELRLKQDVVPGRTIRGWVEVTRPGIYPVLCAELCGVAHGVMKGNMYVHTPEEYQLWLAGQTAPAPEAAAPDTTGKNGGSTGS